MLLLRTQKLGCVRGNQAPASGPHSSGRDLAVQTGGPRFKCTRRERNRSRIASCCGTYLQIKPPGSGSGAMTMRTALATKNPCSLGLSDVSPKASDQDGLLPNKTVDRQKHFYGDNFSRQQNQMIPGTRRNNGDRGDVQTCQCILNPLS